jgi:hypothetical protein
VGIYVNQKCGGCGRSLTGGYVSNYSGIGNPFHVCGHCATVYDNSFHMMEWKLKSALGKSFFVFRHVFSVVLYYGVGAFLLSAFVGKHIGIHTTDGVLVASGFAIAVGLLRFLFRLTSAIKDSNARMNSPTYVAKLELLFNQQANSAERRAYLERLFQDLRTRG